MTHAKRSAGSEQLLTTTGKIGKTLRYSHSQELTVVAGLKELFWAQRLHILLSRGLGRNKL